MKSNVKSFVWTPFAAVFLQICRLFEVLTRFIHKMTLLVAIFAVAGCVYMLESVFFLNVEVFGVNDSLGERIRVFSVGNVEPIFKNWFRLSMLRPSSLSIHA